MSTLVDTFEAHAATSRGHAAEVALRTMVEPLAFAIEVTTNGQLAYKVTRAGQTVKYFQVILCSGSGFAKNCLPQRWH